MTKEELKQKRMDLGLTQTRLAEILGVKGNTVARWENGVLDIPIMVGLAMQAVEMNHGKQAVPVVALASDNKKSLPSAVTKTAITEKVVNLPELPNGDKWLKTAEIAERLGIKAHSTIRDFYNKQGLAHTRLGMVSYVKESDLNAFLANRTARGRSKP